MNILDKLEDDSIISKNLNLEILSAKEGNSSVKMTIDKKVLNPYQIVHGGAIFSLADTAAGAAAISFNDAYVTMDSYINFMNPGTGEFLSAKATTDYKGENTCVVEVIVTNDENKLIAKAMFTMYKVEISA